MERRILVAGGDRFAAAVLQDLCTDLGWWVRRLDRAADAVQPATDEAPSALLLFADREGLAACARLRRDPRTRRLPILCVAGTADLPAQIQALERGADDCVPYPFDASDVAARITRALDFRRFEAGLAAPAVGPAVRGARLRLRPFATQPWEGRP